MDLLVPKRSPDNIPVLDDLGGPHMLYDARWAAIVRARLDKVPHRSLICVEFTLRAWAGIIFSLVLGRARVDRAYKANEMLLKNVLDVQLSGLENCIPRVFTAG
jgi:hypothetical protein